VPLFRLASLVTLARQTETSQDPEITTRGKR
jgi:hypothetical protein